MYSAWIELISPREIQQIHEASMKLLAEVGVHFPHDDAISVFKGHGVKTGGFQVYLDENQLMKAIDTAPKQFPIEARNPERSVTVGDGESILAPGYGAPFLVDAEEGKRAPTIEDYHNLARLAHALPNQDLSGHLLVEPGGLPPGAAHLQMMHANMTHSDKPFIGSSEGLKGTRHTLEIASILFAGDIKERPVCIGLINSLTPLGYSDEMLAALMEYARWGQPVMIAALAMAGSTSPVTLAGTLALQCAELLALCLHTLSPGRGHRALHPGRNGRAGPHREPLWHRAQPVAQAGSAGHHRRPDVQHGYENGGLLLRLAGNGPAQRGLHRHHQVAARTRIRNGRLLRYQAL